MNINEQIRATTQRYQERRPVRESNERLIREGHPLQVDSPERIEKFVARRVAGIAEGSLAPHEDTGDVRNRISTLERVLGTNDLIGVAFLERGLLASRAVGRIWIGVRTGRLVGYGTGFLISPRLVMTNNHVFENASVAGTSRIELGYEVGCDGQLQKSTTFDLAPEEFFVTNEHLDYTVVAITGDTTTFGALPLIEAEGKAIIAQWLNIIQHPNGEPKQLSLRENQFVDLQDDFLTYKTDTAPGSSGSPVFNDLWEVVGLHHSGVPEKNTAGDILAIDGSIWEPSMGEQRVKWVANEGVRVSKIINDLRNSNLTAAQRTLLTNALNLTANEGTPQAANPPTTTAGSASVTVDAAGNATWTIPIRLTVNIGGTPTPPASLPPPAPSITPARAPSTPPAGTSDESTALAQARAQLTKRGDVLRVEMGYVFKDGWITDERAIVVTVRKKLPLANLREANINPLPDHIGGYPVEVTTPTIEDLLAAQQGAASAERTFNPPSLQPNEITYQPPAAPLTKVTDTMTVIAHASPDTGWAQLEPFLKETKTSLVVGMYDFGAPHILDAITSSKAKRMTLVIQPGQSVGEGTKADDLKDAEVIDALREHFGNKFQQAWVRIGRVNGWVASSYHIKVAVRDHKAFWLSSGNWQSSNQPNAQPLGTNDYSYLRQYNREWHAIVHHDGLAETFEEYLNDDYQGNQATPEETLNLPDVILPAAFFLPSTEEKANRLQYFDAFTATRKFTVTPVLTPDNYHQVVLDLIKSAKDELIIQNQTFNAPGDNHEYLKELIDAVIERHNHGVNVRVIFRILFAADARENLTALKEYGFPVKQVRVQKNCHTKGVIVDQETVLIGSQNWSNDGVSLNRDASLLFEDADVATYYRTIFEHDWDNLARQNIGSESIGPEIAPANAPTPDGMVRLSWKDYLEMQ